MSRARYKLELRGPDLRPLGKLDTYESAHFVLKDNVPDTFEVKFPLGNFDSDFIAPGNGVILSKKNPTTNLFETVASGPFTDIGYDWANGPEMISISGVSDDIVLEDRFAIPSASPYTASDYDVITGVAETVMKSYVAKNGGPSTVAPERIIAGLSNAPDLARGSTVTGRARFDPLGDLLRQLAIDGGDLKFGVVQVGYTLQFYVQNRSDLSDEVVFSQALRNLDAISYKRRGPTANAITAGGTGEGTARVFREGSDPASIVTWARRIERFKDQRNTGVAAELDQAVLNELIAAGEQTNLSVTPSDTKNMRFFEDYFVGDIVGIEFPFGTVADAIREVDLSIDKDGKQVIKPTVGEPGAGIKNFLPFRQLKAVAQRISKLERR